jgi:hypothetical protein
MQLSRRVSIFIAAALLSAVQLRAQQRELPLAGPGVIAGLVTDTAGRPVDGATVFLAGRNREIRTNADGEFRFTGILTTDTLMLVVRRIGFFPLQARVPIGEEGRQVVVQLRPRIMALPVVLTEAEVTGLRGVVSDTMSNPLTNADVSVIGAASADAKTDSAGRFSVQIKPGQYMVRVTKSGHVAQMVGVTIPARGGRAIAVRMTPGRDPYQAREGWYAGDLRERLVHRSAAYSKVFSREDIERLNPRDLSGLASSAAAARVDPECTAQVNGGLTQVPLWSLDPEEIEFMEVYVRMPDRPGTGTGINPRGRTSINGAAGLSTQSAGRANRPMPGGGGRGQSPCGAAVIVWTAR